MQGQDQQTFSLLRSLGPQPASITEAVVGGLLAGLLLFLIDLLLLPVGYALIAGVLVGLAVTFFGLRKVRHRPV